MGKWLTDWFWILDVMVLGLLAFFIVLGGVDLGKATGLAAVVAALALVGGGWTWRKHRRQQGRALSPESRRWRERRGF